MMGNSKAGTSAGGQESTKNRVKEQGSQVAQQAAHRGQEVARSATDQGRQIVQETGRRARGLVDQAQAELVGQAGEQQKRAAQGLRTVSDQLRSMADKSDQQGTASDLVHQTSDRVQRVADWLEHREPGQVVDDVRNFARRHPGAFLTGAAVAGVLAGRLPRNMAGGADQGRGAVGPQEMVSQESGHAEMAASASWTPPAANVPPPAAQPAGARA